MDITTMHVSFVEGVYITSLAIGFLLSLCSLMLGGTHGDTGHFDTTHSISSDTSGTHLSTEHNGVQENTPTTISSSILNIQALFAFLLGFGAGGLVTYTIVKVPLISLILAVLTGLLCWWLIRKILNFLLKYQTKFLDLTLDDAIGVTGLVTTTIYPNSVGEVMYPVAGTNHIVMAKSDLTVPIEKGEPVVIMKMQDGVATVILASNTCI